MTDYNDGKWHGWNGGECPVHPLTEVHFVWVYDSGVTQNESESAADVCWEGYRSGKIVAFRVVKEYKEPLELWVIVFSDGEAGFAWNSKEEAEVVAAQVGGQAVRVREVIEDE